MDCSRKPKAAAASTELKEKSDDDFNKNFLIWNSNYW
jgi:hypothetical protein